MVVFLKFLYESLKLGFDLGRKLSFSPRVLVGGYSLPTFSLFSNSSNSVFIRILFFDFFHSQNKIPFEQYYHIII